MTMITSSFYGDVAHLKCGAEKIETPEQLKECMGTIFFYPYPTTDLVFVKIDNNGNITTHTKTSHTILDDFKSDSKAVIELKKRPEVWHLYKPDKKQFLATEFGEEFILANHFPKSFSSDYTPAICSSFKEDKLKTKLLFLVNDVDNLSLLAYLRRTALFRNNMGANPYSIKLIAEIATLGNYNISKIPSKDFMNNLETETSTPYIIKEGITDKLLKLVSSIKGETNSIVKVENTDKIRNLVDVLEGEIPDSTCIIPLNLNGAENWNHFKFSNVKLIMAYCIGKKIYMVVKNLDADGTNSNINGRLLKLEKWIKTSHRNDVTIILGAIDK